MNYGGATIQVERIGGGVLITFLTDVDGKRRVIHFPNAQEAEKFAVEVWRVATSTADTLDDASLAALLDDPPKEST